jgi:hypothetical protein
MISDSFIKSSSEQSPALSPSNLSICDSIVNPNVCQKLMVPNGDDDCLCVSVFHPMTWIEHPTVQATTQLFCDWTQQQQQQQVQQQQQQQV